MIDPNIDQKQPLPSHLSWPSEDFTAFSAPSRPISTDFDQMIFAEGISQTMNCSESMLNNNVVVVGASGSGKTMSVIEPHLLRANHSSLVVTCTKKRIVDSYIHSFVQRGYKVLNLDFIHPEQSNTYFNPFDYVKSVDDIRNLAETIIKMKEQNGGRSRDPFWDEAGTSMLTAEIAAVMAIHPHPTLQDLKDFHFNIGFITNDESITNYDFLFPALSSSGYEFAERNWKSYAANSRVTRSCICGIVTSALSNFENDSLWRHSIPPLDLYSLATEKTVLFLTTSPVSNAANSMVTMLYSMLFKTLYTQAQYSSEGRLPIPVHFLCDDFAAGCQVPKFDQYISTFREFGISVTLLLQSESQLSSLYGDRAATTILNNCDTYLFLGCSDLDTAESISLRCGRSIIDVLSMPPGNLIVLQRGKRPVFAKRYALLQDPLWKENMSKETLRKVYR